MGALRTCCGYYCASVSLVGVYFFILMAIMEFRGNTYLIQMLQRIPCGKTEDGKQLYNEANGLCCLADWYNNQATSQEDKDALNCIGAG